MLDCCWDNGRRRRARRHAGENPDCRRRPVIRCRSARNRRAGGTRCRRRARSCRRC
ncbi:MAG: DUF2630 family protein [Proteobacteria bacterium]|nr:DUF2630 family protein [Pseudomonadota bacterium]